MRTTTVESDADPVQRQNFQRRVAVEEKLLMLCQELSPGEVANSTPAQINAASATAELYRLASLLYLQRVVPIMGDEVRRATYLQQIFTALGTLRVATSPWPVFITACEARKEEERIHIVDVLDRMDKVRNIGNVRVMRGIIEMIWKQQDLRDASDKSEAMQWWLCMESSVPAPWFV